MIVIHAVATACYALLGATLAGNLWYLARARRRAQVGITGVTIVIPARDEADNLARLVPTLLAQRHPDFSVVIVDDESTDRTAEVLAQIADTRVRTITVASLPAGWLGKPHALFVGTRTLTTELLLFLDADTAFADRDALGRLVGYFEAIDGDVVMGGVLRYRGGGVLLVSALPFMQMVALPMFLAPLLGRHAPAGLGGQCWMIRRTTYQRYEPHQALRAEVLEDVRIGQLLQRNGVQPYTRDFRGEVSVWMYPSLADAWRGFRKNAYLLLGGAPLAFLITHLLYWATFVVAPLVWWPLLLTLVVLKGVVDWWIGWSPFLALVAPLSMLSGALLQLDSAWTHWRGSVRWKGRLVVADRGERAPTD